MATPIVTHSAAALARTLERRAGFLADLLELAARDGFSELKRVATPEALALTTNAIMLLAQQLHAALGVEQ